MPITSLGIGNVDSKFLNDFMLLEFYLSKLRLSLCIGPGTILNSLKQNRKTLHNDANWSGLPGWPADMSTVDNFADLQASTDNSGLYDIVYTIWYSQYQASRTFHNLQLSLLSWFDNWLASFKNDSRRWSQTWRYFHRFQWRSMDSCWQSRYHFWLRLRFECVLIRWPIISPNS